MVEWWSDGVVEWRDAVPSVLIGVMEKWPRETRGKIDGVVE